jgi:Mrp family chromosome partitioning ATPase
VLVAAGDVADGRVGEWFGVPTGRPSLAGLAEVGSLDEVEAAMQKTAVDGLWLLTTAPSPRWEPVEAALAGQAIPLLLRDGWAVVVDCPPGDLSTAPTELAPLRPVTVVVAATGRTTHAQLSAAVDVIGPAGGPVHVLLNDVPRRLVGHRGPRP